MKKIKIGLFVDNFYPEIDGVIMVVDNYARNLMKYGEVVVIAPTYGKKADLKYDLPYRVIRVKSIRVPLAKLRLGVPKLDMKLVEELSEEKFDIVHIHSPFTLGRLGIRVAKKLNVPVVGTMHTQFKFEFMKYTKSEKISDLMVKEVIETYSLCDECWAVNSNTADVFKEYGYPKKINVIPNGTEMKLSEYDSTICEKVNKLYNLKEDIPILLFVGRINIVKNIFFIADVLKELKKKNVKYKMLFVGTGPDEELLKERIKNDGLEDNVVFCEQVKDRKLLSEIYMRSTLLVFPSLFDTSSLVQIEAASQMTPTIFIEGSVTAGTVIPDVNGFTSENDVNKFANKIIYILKNKDFYSKVAKNAHEQLYINWEQIVSIVYKKYLKMIK